MSWTIYFNIGIPVLTVLISGYFLLKSYQTVRLAPFMIMFRAAEFRIVISRIADYNYLMPGTPHIPTEYFSNKIRTPGTFDFKKCSLRLLPEPYRTEFINLAKQYNVDISELM